MKTNTKQTENLAECGNKSKPLLAPVFDFQKGDVVEFCDEHYFVIENKGNNGVVNPFGENYYLRGFFWDFQGVKCKFIRKPTSDELERLGLK